jgi:hypothetical protein
MCSFRDGGERGSKKERARSKIVGSHKGQLPRWLIDNLLTLNFCLVAVLIIVHQSISSN